MRVRRSQMAWTGFFLFLSLSGVGGAMFWRWYQRADPTALFSRAEKAYQNGRYAEADAALERLARVRRPTAVVHYLRAQVDVGLKRDQHALAALAAIPDDHPLAPLARLRAGQIEVRIGRTRPAEAAFLAVLKLLPNAVQPRKELVYIYNIQHRQAELDAQLIALLELNEIDFQIVLHWTKTRNTVWKPAVDLPFLQKYVAADPDDRWSRLALVDALHRLSRLDEAERELEAFPPSDPDARTRRVAIAMDRGDFAVAESLLAAGPRDDPRLALLRGQFALQRGDGAAAVDQFRIALAADPIDRVALSGLGTSLRQAGHAEQAQPYIDAAGRHDELWRLVARAATAEGERDPALPHHLGMACAAAGRLQEARAWLKLAIARDPLDSECQRTLFEIEHAGKPGPPAPSAPGEQTRRAGERLGPRRQDAGRFAESMPGGDCDSERIVFFV